ncbi:grpE family protein [Neorickettsia helminthoeca str. Oregon]|uniref:Protein GrpE n=1 Tax=Neorickettsia helminthoeca str. Oregon TaxID=1286528 RepID=X5HLB0_9RICK|nr:nucleotide exchange factor GrpE [Neorickettsia helminthoeca]AHX11160.1 grpE family protein [Neorickettsia helminthoeca str. Oregon]
MSENKSDKETKRNEERDPIFKKIIQERAPKNEESSGAGFISEEDFKKEVDLWKKKLMYALAEQENLKKNVAREIEKTRDFAISDLAKEILTSVESLEKAVAHMVENKIEGPLLEGSKLTLEAIFSALKKGGVEKIEAKGVLFDHNVHQAVSTVKNDELPNNTVFEVLQDGYIIKGRLLRPAIVVVVENGCSS